ncbi:MAG: HEAT repeat domain-containing protein [Candidatus Hydrogenedentes bacterium]|nr:HEAT repeat domain-containing protein [Candidatus Hydrogenedentota bacterium]
MRAACVTAIWAWCVIAVADDPAVVGGGKVKLQDLAGSSTLVTIVIKNLNAEDANLQIVEVNKDFVSVVTAEGERNAYRLSDIKEIRVQGALVEAKEFKLDENRALGPEEQKVVARALERARQIFDASNDNQMVKMDAAVLLAVNADTAALDYLRQLVVSNDLPTALEAGLRLYLVGDAQTAAPVVSQGLVSGNRRTRGTAALLSGLIGDHSVEGALLNMAQDRATELSVPAARALARLGNRDVIPILLSMISDLDDVRSEAGVFGLSRLGGDDILEQMRVKLDKETGLTRYNVVRVLNALGDPTGKSLLRAEMLEIPSLTKEAALLLARGGDPGAIQRLRDHLATRFNPTDANLIYRARAAATLIENEDRAAIAILMELLHLDNPPIVKRVCQLSAATGKRSLLTITSPMIESLNPEIALAACSAAVALVKPDYRQRLLETLP